MYCKEDYIRSGIRPYCAYCDKCAGFFEKEYSVSAAIDKVTDEDSFSRDVVVGVVYGAEYNTHSGYCSDAGSEYEVCNEECVYFPCPKKIASMKGEERDTELMRLYATSILLRNDYRTGVSSNSI